MKRWITITQKPAFIVEHDFIMATYLADQVVVFSGTPAKESLCTAPESMVSGMNRFLKMMDITFRRDPANFRPRINKSGSQKEQEQIASGNYFFEESILAPTEVTKGKSSQSADVEEKKVAPKKRSESEDENN